MDKHDHARHLGEGCVESVAWRISASSVKGLLIVMVMMVHLYVALFMARFRTLASNQWCTPPSRYDISCTTLAPAMAIATRTDLFIPWTYCTSICNPSSFLVSYCMYILSYSRGICLSDVWHWSFVDTVHKYICLFLFFPLSGVRCCPQLLHRLIW